MLEKQCKLADVSPVFKRKNPKGVVNYRPVGFLPSASNFFPELLENKYYLSVMHFYRLYCVDTERILNVNMLFYHLLESRTWPITKEIMLELYKPCFNPLNAKVAII